MTDKYGSDHEHDLADHEHGDIEHPEAEAWHGDHPPVDDFADHTGEEVASVSEEAEPVEDLEASEIVAEKKATSLLPIIAGVGLLLILGAGLYWQFGISKSGSTSNQYAQTPPPLAIPLVPAAIPNTNANISPITASTVNAIPASDIAPTTSYAPPSQPAAATTVASGMTNGVAIPQPVPVASVGPVTAATPPAAVATAPAAIPNLPPVISQPPLTATAGNNAATGNASPAIDGRLNTLSNRVEDLQKSLDQATLKLTQVSGMLANQMATSPSNAAIEERLNKIEQQMMHIQHTGAASISPSISVQAPAVTTDASSTEAASSSQSTSSTTEHPAHKAHTTVATTAAKSKPVPQHATSKVSHPMATAAVPQTMAMPHDMWVLRAATPNEAWVAKNATTSDLHHIQVGDSLAGIGQIRAIHQSAEGWVIEGSQGTIR